MPKTSVTRGKTIRHSTPLHPTLKYKGITRTRMSTGRATSRTKKKAEEYIQDPTPTPSPSDPPGFNPTEMLGDGEQGEEEECVVEPLKGPSRAVSVSPHLQRIMSRSAHKSNRPGYLNGSRGPSHAWTGSYVWMVLVVVVSSVPSASNPACSGARTAPVVAFVAKTVSSILTLNSLFIVLRFVQIRRTRRTLLTIFAAMEWTVLRQSAPRFARPHSTAWSPRRRRVPAPLEKTTAHCLRPHRRPSDCCSVLHM